MVTAAPPGEAAAVTRSFGRPSIGPAIGTAPLASGGSVVSTGGVAERYAIALYALASDEHALDEVVDQIDALGRLVDESPILRRLLESPLIDVNAAHSAMQAVLQEQGFSPLVQRFVGVITVNRRLNALRAIITAFAALVAEKRGVVVAQVTSAHPISDVQEQQLRARLIEAGYGSVNIVKQVDPGLLGGLVVRIGARLYDSSLKSRLQRLQYAMKGAA